MARRIGMIWDACWQTPSSGFGFGGISFGDGGDGGGDFVRTAKK